MRTTVDVPDHLLVEVKKLAAERRLPLARLFEESLRAYLSEQRRSRIQTAPPLPVLRGPTPRSAADLDDTSGLWELP
jgi:hypothetical protein